MNEALKTIFNFLAFVITIVFVAIYMAIYAIGGTLGILFMLVVLFAEWIVEQVKHLFASKEK